LGVKAGPFNWRRFKEFLFDNPGDILENASPKGKHSLALKSNGHFLSRIQFLAPLAREVKKGGRPVERRKALTSLGVGVVWEWEVGWGNPTPHGLGFEGSAGLGRQL